MGVPLTTPVYLDYRHLPADVVDHLGQQSSVPAMPSSMRAS
jgi:hypothetical protein